MKRALAAAAAALLAGSAIAAEDEADFAASKGSAAEAQLHARLRASVRTIPGTDTKYFIGGYLQVDGQATRHRQEGDEQDVFIVSATPFGPADASYRLSARQSQFNWISRTPSAIGDIDTRLEANLFPLDGRTAPTLNQLYVRFGEWVTLGKTYSTFIDEDVLPTTLDYNGPSGVTFARQALARASIPVAEGWTVQVAAEDSQADIAGGGTLLSVRSDAKRPDLVARVRAEGERGHLQLAGLWRSVDLEVESTGDTRRRHVSGSGVSLSGSLAVGAENTLSFQAAGGKGIGRYFNDPLGAVAVAAGSGNRFEMLRTTGVTLYYERKWAPDWMTVAGASTLQVEDGDALRRPDELRRVTYASANIVHRMTPTLLVGAELLWGEASRIGGGRATNARLQLSMRYLLFQGSRP